jgi:hypothetical protein
MYHSIIFDLFGSRRSCFHKFTYVHTGHINLEYELINSRICQHIIYIIVIIPGAIKSNDFNEHEMFLNEIDLVGSNFD